MVSRHAMKKRAKARKNAAAAKSRSGEECSITKPDCNLLSAKLQSVEQNSSLVLLDGGRVESSSSCGMIGENFRGYCT